jgi:flagellar protein FlgJ
MNAPSSIPSIFDSQPLTQLKNGVRADDPKALKAAAQQFEAVFLQMVMKSMRAATPQEGMFDSEQTRFYQELLDSQLAQVMSANGGTGLASMIERQLSRPSTSADVAENPDGYLLVPPSSGLPFPQSGTGLPLPQDAAPKGLPIQNAPVRSLLQRSMPTSNAGTTNSTQEFTQAVWPQAVSASQQTGIPPQFLVAHAALESGWGRSVPLTADGRSSFNLFGIKAGSSWNGPVAESVTTEYVNGRAEKRTERFRAYSSYTEAFADYANLLKNQPRFAQVLGSQNPVAFSQGLQNAGYATDPQYADKLLRVIGSLS